MSERTERARAKLLELALFDCGVEELADQIVKHQCGKG